ncbi:unnamed protein product, partial [Cuscuta epithymum]
MDTSAGHYLPLSNITKIILNGSGSNQTAKGDATKESHSKRRSSLQEKHGYQFQSGACTIRDQHSHTNVAANKQAGTSTNAI